MLSDYAALVGGVTHPDAQMSDLWEPSKIESTFRDCPDDTLGANRDAVRTLPKIKQQVNAAAIIR
jgi:hypothetical protein